MNKSRLKSFIRTAFPVQEESGNALVIAAVILFVVILIGFLQLRIRSLYSAVTMFEDSVQYAAESAARPDPSAISAGNFQINTGLAMMTARSHLALSVRSNPYTTWTERDVVRNSFVEVFNPTGTDCVTPQYGDGRCFYTPGVAVTAAIEMSFLGIPVLITRTGIATTGISARPDGVEEVRATSTPIAIPGVVVTTTPASGPPSATSTPLPTMFPSPTRYSSTPLPTMFPSPTRYSSTPLPTVVGTSTPKPSATPFLPTATPKPTEKTATPPIIIGTIGPPAIPTTVDQ
jgi:hypothetical protein